jgi:hypothetical protein
VIAARVTQGTVGHAGSRVPHEFISIITVGARPFSSTSWPSSGLRRRKALPRRLVNLTHSQMASSKPAASLITKTERLASQNAPAVGSLKQALGCQVEARQATRNLTPDRAGSLKLAFTRLVRLAQSDLQWPSVTWSTIWTVKATEREPLYSIDSVRVDGVSSECETMTPRLSSCQTHLRPVGR